MQNRNIHSDLLAILERITTNLNALKRFQQTSSETVRNIHGSEDSRTDPILLEINTHLVTAGATIQALTLPATLSDKELMGLINETRTLQHDVQLLLTSSKKFPNQDTITPSQVM